MSNRLLEMFRPLRLGDPRASLMMNFPMMSEFSNDQYNCYPNSPSQEKSYHSNDWLSSENNCSYLEQTQEDDNEIVDHLQSYHTGRIMDPSYTVSDLEKWLLSDIATPGPASVDLFRHIVKDPEVWLRKVSYQLKSLEDMKSQDPFQHISKEPSTWLRSRFHSRSCDTRDSEQDLFSHVSTDPSLWLSRRGSFLHRDVSTLETMSALSGTQSNPTKKWLMQSASLPKGKQVFQHVRPILSFLSPGDESSATWLKPPTIPTTNRDEQVHRGDRLRYHQLPSDDTPWLMNSNVFCNMSVSHCDMDLHARKETGDYSMKMSDHEPTKINSYRIDWKDWVVTNSQHEQRRCERSTASNRTDSARNLDDWLFTPPNQSQFEEYCLLRSVNEK